MPLNGTLRTWNADRGFGFIAPRDGGRELFVHFSAFPRDGSRPAVGESLVYELGRGKDGKPQAVGVYRQALGLPSQYPRARHAKPSRRSSRTTFLVALLLVAGIGAYAYKAFQKHPREPVAGLAQPDRVGAEPAAPAAAAFRCDGRTYCSQMTSCAEAKFFLKNCPGTQMDGNHDGVPCQEQWCTGSFAK